VSKKRLAIIGNGMATSRLLDELTRRQAETIYKITVFGEERHGCYNRILLGRILSGGEQDDIMLKPPAWYADRGVEYHAGVTVTSLDPLTRQLTGSDGATHSYDVAILATGSVPFMPPVAGMRDSNGKFLPGVFPFRTMDDSERIRAEARPASNAIVVGGGLLGLEAAKALCDLGMHVTVLHKSDTLMNTQVDVVGGRLLRRAVENLGIWVRTGSSPAEILGDQRVRGVKLESGEILPADLVVFACGIRPRIDLAKSAGVPVRHGVLVNDTLATAVPGVYAVGECAEHAGKVYGIVQPIYEQCSVLADLLTASNPQSRYRGSKMYTRLKVAGVEVAALGMSEPERDSDEVVEVLEERRGVYRKLLIRDHQLIGALLVGDTSAAASLVQLFDRGERLPPNRLDVLASGDAMPTTKSTDREVCNCYHVPTSVLVGAIRSGQTKAGTGCGSCRGQLADLILQHGTTTSGRGDAR
jgi:nitrite reductase (NADH) large subunit